MYQAWSLAMLQFRVTRNYFFEKYAFLKYDKPTHRLLYLLWYLLKNQLLFAVGLVALAFFLDLKELSALIGIILLFFFFFRTDTLDWKLFERRDIILAYPRHGIRFIIVLARNLLVKFILEENICFIIIVICLLLALPSKSTIILMLGLIITVALLFLSAQAYHFVVLYGSLKIKKAISVIQYFITTTIVVIASITIINGIIGIISFTIENIKTKEEFNHYLLHSVNLAALGEFLIRNLPYILLTTTLLFFLCIGAASYSLHAKTKGKTPKSMSGCTTSHSRTGSFGILRKLAKISRPRNNALVQSLFKKEFQLFEMVYNYKFKDYPYILGPDRAAFFLAIVGYFLLKYPTGLSSLIFFVATISMLTLSIYSATTMELVTNMSFASDYNTLKLFNITHVSPNLSFNAKLRFFYSIKAFSFLLFFAIFNTIASLLHTSHWLTLVLNIVCLYIVFTFPRLYLTNNLIYTKLNYQDIDALLIDEALMETGAREFFPLRMYTHVTMSIFLLLIVINVVVPSTSSELLFIPIIITQILFFYILTKTMDRVRTNIFAFIERGDYTANFAKIFKQQKNRSHR